MYRPVKIATPFIVLLVLLSACVPAKRHSDLRFVSRQNVEERDRYRSENIQLSMANRELEARAGTMSAEYEQMKRELDRAVRERDQARSDLSRMDARYRQLEIAQEDLVRGNVRETTRLLSELQEAHANLQQQESRLRQMEANIDQKKIELDELTFELEQRNQRLVELEQILDSQQRAVRELRDKVAEALFGFEGQGLTVSMRSGNVYVSLDEQLLFRTGSYEIDDAGRNALRRLASVLEVNPTIQIMIEGHTDDVPFRSSGGPIVDNWDLSVKRATSVVRELTTGTGIDPARLTAAGRSEYHPVDERSTAEARARNRRTEIVLTPDLTALYNIIDSF